MIYTETEKHWCRLLNSSPSAQNGHHSSDNIFKYIFMNAKFCILIQISLEFVPKGPIDNNSALFGAKPLLTDPVHWCIHVAPGADELIIKWSTEGCHPISLFICNDRTWVNSTMLAKILQDNSLWLIDAVWYQRTWSTMVQIMACCLIAPSHYLNQCQLTCPYAIHHSIKITHGLIRTLPN